MILEILTYTHNITTMLFGIFLSAFFLGVKKDKTNVGKLLLLAVISGGLYMVCVSVLGPEMMDQIYPLIVRLPYRGDAGGILGIVPLCLPDDGDAVDQDESGITADRKSAAGVLYF